jgi:tetratricopeptide (TPR) repeat protein
MRKMLMEPSLSYRKGMAFFERGDYRESVLWFQQALKETPEDKELSLWLVQALDAYGAHDEALNLCRPFTKSPDPKISKQARSLLVVMEAVPLSRPSRPLPDPKEYDFNLSNAQTGASGTSASASPKTKISTETEEAGPTSLPKGYLWIVAALVSGAALVWLIWVR